jgi:hypothetical protein
MVIPEGGSYHIETWDGGSWQERVVRGRTPILETDLVDLAPFLPDADGEYKLRIRHSGPGPATLDYVALLSGGALVAPNTATLEPGQDVLTRLRDADDVEILMTGGTVLLHFPPAPSPSLVFRARERELEFFQCERSSVWQRHVPIDLSGNEERSISDLLPTPEVGPWVLRAELLGTNGEKVASAVDAFDVLAAASPSVTIRVTPEVPEGTLAHVTGIVHNPTSSDLNIVVRAHQQSRLCTGGCLGVVFEGSVSVPAVGQAPFAFDVTAVSGGNDLRVVVDTATGIVSETNAHFEGVTPEQAAAITFGPIRVPDPPIRLVPSTFRPVDLDASALDASLDPSAGDELVGDLPFPVDVRGQAFTAFRQHSNGFLELLPDSAAPRSEADDCVGMPSVNPVIFGGVGDLRLGTGPVGYDFYSQGASDRSGRVFTADTVVFVWDVLDEDGSPARFQVLIARDGLIRVDVAALTTTFSECPRSGLTWELGAVAVSDGEAAPYGFRLEHQVGYARPFQGTVELQNSSAGVGTVELSYGPDGGPRQTLSAVVPGNDARVFTISDQITESNDYVVEIPGSPDVLWLATADGLVARYVGPHTAAPGLVAVGFDVHRTGGVGGPVAVTLHVTGAAGEQTFNRLLDLEPGFVTREEFVLDLAVGSYTMTWTADVPVTAEPAVLVVVPAGAVSLTASVGARNGTLLPIAVDIENSSAEGFAGALQVDGPSGIAQSVSAAAGGQSHIDLAVNLSGLAVGPQTWIVRLVSSAGVVLGETSVTYDVLGPRVVLADSPDGESFDLGDTAPLRFVLQNTTSVHRAASTSRCWNSRAPWRSTWPRALHPR